MPPGASPPPPSTGIAGEVGLEKEKGLSTTVDKREKLKGRGGVSASLQTQKHLGAMFSTIIYTSSLTSS
jgi:hypothetical protein